MRCLFAAVGMPVFVGLLLACGACVSQAAEAKMDLSGAVEAARAAKTQFTPISEAQVEAARSELDSAKNDLQWWLATGSARQVHGWKKYFQWDVLEQELAAGDDADRSKLAAVLAKFSNAEIVGLDLRRFTTVRAALRRYIDALYVKTDKNVEQIYGLQLDALIAGLEAYMKQPSTNTAAAIGGRLDYLERTGQAQQLVDDIRSKFAKPNLQVRASRGFLAKRVERNVHQTAPIRDNILGTSIRGTGTTHGRVTANLLPNDEAATIQLVLSGVNYSRNVGYNGPVTIQSRGVTNLWASKQVTIDADGLNEFRARASARSNSTITDISAKCCLIEKVARRRAGQQKGQVEAIASGRAANRVASRFNAEVRPALAEAEEKYQEKFRKPLVRKGEFPQLLNFSSSEEALFVHARQASGSQLGAPTPAPAFTDDVDVCVRMHESMAGNFAEGMIGGVHLTDERLAEILEKQTGEVPEELQITQDKDPWSITFARRRPASVVFGDDTVRIAVRGSKFTRGENELSELMEISATYTLEQTPEGSKLTRQGDVEVDYPRISGPLAIRQVTFKTLMRRKFGALFKEEFVGEGIELPGQSEDTSTGTLRLAQLDSASGWLAIGWNLVEPAEGAE